MHFYIKTFGCQMNKDDSERIAGLLLAAGFKEASTENQADLIIFNTCSVRQNAVDKLYGQVSSLKQLKEKEGKIVAVGGCVAQTAKEKLLEQLPVDIIFGPNSITQLTNLIQAKQKTAEPVICLGEATAFAADLPAKREHQWHSWLPITVGCNNFCTYCIVPYARGREKSRPLKKLLADARELVEQGVVEITLLGQNVNSYGRDLYGQPRFVELLKELAKIKELKRIKFTTSHPKDFTQGIVNVIAENDNICNYIHLPLQAGSDKILKIMRRGYTADEYLEKVEWIREKIPEAAISTDLMVGFPGETEEDFQATLKLVKEVQFDQAYMFIYSPRPGTKAATLPNQVPEQTKKDRFLRLNQLQNEICQQQNAKLVGKRLNVLVEAQSKKCPEILTGRTDTNKLVHFYGPPSLVGRFIDVVIKEALSTYLKGELINDGAYWRSLSAASAHTAS